MLVAPSPASSNWRSRASTPSCSAFALAIVCGVLSCVLCVLLLLLFGCVFCSCAGFCCGYKTGPILAKRKFDKKVRMSGGEVEMADVRTFPSLHSSVSLAFCSALRCLRANRGSTLTARVGGAARGRRAQPYAAGAVQPLQAERVR